VIKEKGRNGNYLCFGHKFNIPGKKMEERVIGVNMRKVQFYKSSERVNGIKKNEY